MYIIGRFLVLLLFIIKSQQTPYGHLMERGPSTRIEQSTECGLHGRFEYCIDGIPGCIIGCHCHPGYYFDTETKICESSTKILHEARRFYQPPEPPSTPPPPPPTLQAFPLVPSRPHLPPQKIAQVQDLQAQHEPQYLQTPQAAQTLTSRRNSQLEQSQLLTEIADYISNDPAPTEKNEENLEDWLYEQFSKTIQSQLMNKSTRRSGGDSAYKVSLRRKTKPKITKKHLKAKKPTSKLRAIDENDSIFDSAESDEDDESKDSGKDDKDNDEKDDFCKNGGKKMIIIKKSPKMPLPPIIFMPQADSSYYPSGLPPPPPLTMFPIVPVPPMMPLMPIFPPPSSNSSCSTSDSNNSTTTTSAPTTTSTTPKSKGRSKVRKTPRKTNAFLGHPQFSRSNKNVKKIAQAIDKIAVGENPSSSGFQSPLFGPGLSNSRNKKTNTLVPNPLMTMDDKEILPSRRVGGYDNSKSGELDEQMQDESNTGFRYLTDLIHSFDSPTKPVKKMDYSAFGLKPDTSHKPSPDEMYFTNLGKEIVSLMKQMDHAGTDSDSDVENSGLHMNLNTDRQVRSPTLKNKRINKQEIHQPSEHVGGLSNLEREVYEAVTSAPALSLIELEERIRKIDEEIIEGESSVIDEEEEQILKQEVPHLKVDLLESANKKQAKSMSSRNTGSSPSESVIIHSELRHLEPVSSATIHFELKRSDPAHSVLVLSQPQHSSVIQSAPIHSASLISSPLHEQPSYQAQIGTSPSQAPPTPYKINLFQTERPPKKHRDPKRPELIRFTPIRAQPMVFKPNRPHKVKELKLPASNHVPPIREEARHPQQIRTQSSRIMQHGFHQIHDHIPSTHSVVSGNGHRPPLNTYNKDTSEVQSHSSKNQFVNTKSQNIISLKDYSYKNRPRSHHTPSLPPPPQQYQPKNSEILSTFDQWELDKQGFLYPKLTWLDEKVDNYEAPKVPEKPEEALPTEPSLNVEPILIVDERTTDTKNTVPLSPYPYHRRLYRQYFFPYVARTLNVRHNHDIPSPWYFESK